MAHRTPHAAAPRPPQRPATTLDQSDVEGRSTKGEKNDGPKIGAPALVRLERFEILERLGQGAFGTVYRAYDPQLDRDVALKIAKPERVATPEQVRRFLREARAAAGLRHPNIVPVFDAGNEGGHFYIASAFIQGQTLEASLAQQRPTPRQAARRVRRLAEALAYAHDLGIVHRDVKPANIMTDERGRPLLMDFGLAAQMAGEERLTREGAILGTPLYMAPEQAGGADPQPASDQYSLGIVLYEMLCGRTPFHGPPDVVIFHHLRTPPPPPRRAHPGVPRDLETICLKALAKEPRQRYLDCQDMASDLRRWLDDEPIRARRARLPERISRWCRREPWLAAVSGVALAALVAMAAMFYRSSVRDAASARASQAETARTEQALREYRAEAKARKGETESRKLAEDRERRAITEKQAEARIALRQGRSAEYLREFNQALQELKAGATPLAMSRLDRTDPSLRGWEWAYAMTLCRRRCRVLNAHHAPVDSVAFSPNGNRLVTVGLWQGVGERDQAVVWDVSSGRPIASWPSSGERFAFTPTGKSLVGLAAYRQPDGYCTYSVRDVLSGKPVSENKWKSAWTNRSPISRNGERYVDVEDREIRVLKVSDGTVEVRLNGHRGAISLATFSPNGRFLASLAPGEPPSPPGRRGPPIGMPGSLPRTGNPSRTVCELKVWDVAAGKPVFEDDGAVNWRLVEFSADGRRLAATGQNLRDGSREVQVWEIATKQKLLSARVASGPAVRGLEGPGNVTDMVFSPSGDSLAARTSDAVTIWHLRGDASAAKTISVRAGLRGCLTFTADGGRLVVGNRDGTIVLCNAATGRVEQVLSSNSDSAGKEVLCVAVDPTGKWLAAGAKNGRALLWRLEPNSEPRTLPGVSVSSSHQNVSFSEDGRVWAAFQGVVRVWETDTGRLLRTLTEPARPQRLALNSDGHRLAILGDDKEYGLGRLVIWDVPGGKRLLSHTFGKSNWYNLFLTLDKTGDRVFLLHEDGKVDVLNALTGETSASYTLPRACIREPRLTTDRLAVSSRDAIPRVQAWDLESGKPLLGEGIKHYGKDLTCGPVLSPNRRLIALVHRRPGTIFDVVADVISIWDVTGRELAALRGHEGVVYDLCFSPDNRSLASIASDGTVRIWDTTTGQQTLTFPAFHAFTPRGPNSEVLGVVFCGNGSRLAAYDKDRTIIWEASARPTHLALTGHTGAVNAVAFSDDGARLVSAGEDGNIVVWNVGGGEEILRIAWPNRGFGQLPAHVGFLNSGRTIFCRGQDRTLLHWDATSGSALPDEVPQPRTLEPGMSFSRDGRRVAQVEDHAVRVRETGSGKEIAAVTLGWSFHACALSADGERVAASYDSYESVVSVFDASTAKSLWKVSEHFRPTQLLAFLPSGKMVIGACSGLLRFWDASNGNELFKLDASRAGIGCMVVSPDGRRLAAAGADMQVHVWDLVGLGLADLPRRPAAPVRGEAGGGRPPSGK